MEQTNPSSASRRDVNYETGNFVVPRSLAYLPRVCSILSFGIAVCCLTAWLADYPPVGAIMNPLSIVGVMLASASLWVSTCSPANKRVIRWGHLFSYCVILVALSKLGHLHFNFSVAPDRILFSGRSYLLNMDGISAFAFFLTGIGLACLDVSYRRISVCQVLCLICFLPPLLIVTSYCYGV